MKKFCADAHFLLLGSLLATLSFSIPHFTHLGFLLILLTANAILSYVAQLRGDMMHWRWCLLFATLFVITAVGLAWTEDVKGGLFVLEKKLALLLFPVIFLVSPPLSEKRFLLLILCFFAGCVGTALYCLASGISHYVLWNDPSFFFYRLMSNSIGMHPIYLSMYYCLALALGFYYSDKVPAGAVSAFLATFAAMILSVSIILLSGRVAIVMLVLILAFAALHWLKKRFSAFQSFLGATALALIIIAVALVPVRNRARLKEALQIERVYLENGQASGAAVRPYIWSCALSIIIERPFSGTGTGDVQRSLNDCYEPRNYHFLTTVENMQFNAHNQFLEQGVAIGLGGILVFLACLVIPTVSAIRVKNQPYLIFMGIFVISCFTESLLERQSGIFFYAAFNALLFFRDSKEEKNPII